MNRQGWSILTAVVLLVGATAAFLVHHRSVQRLGQPGLKVVPQAVYNPEGTVIGTNSVYLPERVLDYTSTPVPVTDVEFGWLPKDTVYGRRLYKAADGFETSVSVVLMGSDRTSIHKPQYCLTGQGWTIERSEQASIDVRQPHPYNLPVAKLTTIRQVKGPGGRLMPLRGLYVYWFVADEQLTADHATRMWWLARDLITRGVLQRWAYVACFTVCAPGQEAAAYARLERFIAAAVPEFQITAGPAETASSSSTRAALE
jgi:hypothetical protein